MKKTKLNELDFNKKATIVIGFLHTFQYLHSKNFVYRDLKPDSLILVKNNHIILIYFDRMINIKEIIDHSLKAMISYKYIKYGYLQYFAPDIKPFTNEKWFTDMIPYSCDEWVTFIKQDEL